MCIYMKNPKNILKFWKGSNGVFAKYSNLPAIIITTGIAIGKTRLSQLTT